METTVCPWCQTEIVWDEEIGPEEVCPHCGNELKGYRTINVQIDRPDDENTDEMTEDDYNEHDHDLHEHAHDHDHNNRDLLKNPFWERDNADDLSVIRKLDSYIENGEELLEYEESIEQILDSQEEIPECPHCREYMLLAGHQTVTGDHYNSVVPASLNVPLLKPPYTLDVYVCSGCFHVSHKLSEDDRLRFIQTLNKSAN
ncbi:hypothetical protein PASE110613_11195 [Paenibacillus sediminis]|uniref:DNA-directed RNA polymerase subunit RPC12/RpoP n=1 Tax=Paenibacillus sediminis TaxID=664909 RepID=A0ABS4H4Q4_9BACL|nr:hypothetical protein [Paenibacillus sediminis]MBP1937520.1 DNA-directed RNA polymerase subunit RPC12/RpoP [Paenibacillus sediminis]